MNVGKIYKKIFLQKLDQIGEIQMNDVTPSHCNLMERSVKVVKVDYFNVNWRMLIVHIDSESSK